MARQLFRFEKGGDTYYINQSNVEYVMVEDNGDVEIVFSDKSDIKVDETEQEMMEILSRRQVGI